MALIFAYLLVGSLIFMLITFAFAGFAWVASGFIFILLLLVSPFVLISRLYNAKEVKAPQASKQAIVAYHKMAYGVMDKSNK